jgi:hypothetical protein
MQTTTTGGANQMSKANAKGCPVNLVPADEDTSSPFRILYQACGQPAYADVRWRGGEDCFCRAHAEEAEREGCTVDWPV